MRRLPLPFALLLCTMLPPVFGQAPAFRSPEVTDTSVTLRYYAPGAHEVALVGLRRPAPVPMTKDKDGVWSVTFGDLAPDLYSYYFSVDGATALDPRNRHFKRWLGCESAVEFTGGTKPAWSLQPVPHGTLHRHLITSAVAGGEYPFQVYTPPGYDPHAPQAYPVVVLLHGYGDDETAWVESGRAQFIADNLLAAGRMQPAVIVMPYGHPRPIPRAERKDYFAENTAAMERLVTGELLPFVERNYHVGTTPAERAIVGLSMGGGHALAIGLGHPGLFRWVGAFSAAVPTVDPLVFFPSAARADDPQRPSLLWVAIGRDDFLLQPNEAFRSWLTRHDVKFTYTLSDGGHEWTNWRDYLAEFLPLLFR